MAASKKTAVKGSRTTGGTKKTAKQTASASKKSNRKMWGFVFLILTLISSLALICADGFLIKWFTALNSGLIGQGWYLLPIAFAASAIILFTAKRRRVSGRVFCFLALPVLYGAFVHIFADRTAYEFTLKSAAELFKAGNTLSSGGLIAGLIGILLCAALSRTGAAILIALLGIACIVFGFGINLPSVAKEAVQGGKKAFGGLRARMKVDYEESDPEYAEAEDEPSRPIFPHGKHSIDIPINGEPAESAAAPEKHKRASSAPRASAVKTPAEVLAAVNARESGQHHSAVSSEEACISAAENAASAAAAPETQAIQPAANDSASAAAAACGSAPDEAALTEQEVRIASETAVSPLYNYPPVSLLHEPTAGNPNSQAEIKANSAVLLDTLKSFGIEAAIINTTRGPSVTRYELQLNRGTKFSRLTSLSDDIALSLGASVVRIAPVPDKVAVGIEVPNRNADTVCIREVIDSPAFRSEQSRIAFAVGKDIAGSCIIGDIAKMPHLLIAGTTGSGKSVCINSLIVSLLYRASPEEVRLIMIDPKMIELGVYNGIPHLLIPVVTDPKKAAGALNWTVGEMMRRYKLFADHGVRDLASYNSAVRSTGEGVVLPQIVVVIDELADLMMAAAREVEESICRVAQLARAAGMHLIIATQRPSADVITGLMKANIPSRIAFAVSSQTNSRIILDTGGAEKLIGRGDMLYAPIGCGKPMRVQGCLINSDEVEAVVEYIKNTGTPDYSQEVIEHIEKKAAENTAGADVSASGVKDDDGADELLPAAIEVVVETGQASVSMLQRRLKLGYSRAARLVDQMEERGIVGPFEGSKPRQLLITKEQWQEMKAGSDE